MSFLKRLLSTLILAPLVLAILYYGGHVFIAFAALILLVALYEFHSISRFEVKKRWRYSVLLFGIVYCFLAFYAFVDLRIEHGFFYTGLILLGVWASDIGAYIFGKLIGGRKLCPSVSPNKTVAGLLGACLFPAFILDYYLFYFVETMEPQNVLKWSLIASVIIGLVGQMGDLFVSMLKRRVGLKDTGRLIPGHGGVLDRIDALMLVIIVFWMMLKVKILLWP
jgi:phosphatidate cytidylyltransferase